MGKSYELPDESVSEVLERVMADHHPRLIAAGVKVTLLVAFGPVNKDGIRTGPAIKVHGVPAIGSAKIVSLKHRVAGLGDAEILIDGDAWDEMSDARRASLIDHELTHIDVVWADGPPVDKEAEASGAPPRLRVLEKSRARPERDEAGRPKLRIRPHDRHFGWFDEVARRHGVDSHEVQQASEFANDVGQLYLRGFESERTG